MTSDQNKEMPVFSLPMLVEAFKQEGYSIAKNKNDDCLLRLLFFEEISSTMDAARLAIKGEFQDKELYFKASFSDSSLSQSLVVLARTQTKGRGRLERSWHSPKDAGLYLTICFPLLNPPQSIPAFTLVIGVTVIKVLSSLTNAKLNLKWPNDICVWASEMSKTLKKAGGILCEVTTVSEMGSWLLCGVGINLYNTLYPPQVLGCSLSEVSNVKFSPVQIAAKLARELEQAAELFFRDGFAFFKEEWLNYCVYKKGDLLNVRQGNQSLVYGCFSSIGDNGELMLMHADGSESAITVGEVSFSDDSCD